MQASEGRGAEGCAIMLGDEAARSLREEVDSGQAVVIKFDRTRREALTAVAAERHGAMKDKELPYGPSTLHGQLVGVLGEAALLVWLYEALPANFEMADDRPGGADAYVRNPLDQQGWTLIEVKTHGSAFWHENGRLVNAVQLPRMSSDILLWCVTPPPLGERVVIIGWSPVREVQANGVPEMTGTKPNVRVNAAMRTPHQLAEWLCSGRRTPLPDSAV